METEFLRTHGEIESIERGDMDAEFERLIQEKQQPQVQTPAAKETPARETPARETPARETPAKETPVATNEEDEETVETPASNKRTRGGQRKTPSTPAVDVTQEEVDNDDSPAPKRSRMGTEEEQPVTAKNEVEEQTMEEVQQELPVDVEKDIVEDVEKDKHTSPLSSNHEIIDINIEQTEEELKPSPEPITPLVLTNPDSDGPSPKKILPPKNYPSLQTFPQTSPSSPIILTYIVYRTLPKTKSLFHINPSAPRLPLVPPQRNPLLPTNTRTRCPWIL